MDLFSLLCVYEMEERVFACFFALGRNASTLWLFGAAAAAVAAAARLLGHFWGEKGKCA